MGNCGENTAKKLGISRQEQDDYGMNSYRRSAEAYSNGKIQSEIGKYLTIYLKSYRRPNKFLHSSSISSSWSY